MMAFETEGLSELYKSLLLPFSVNRQYNTTLRINSIDLTKPIDSAQDRSGFEPLYNTDLTKPIDHVK